MKGKFKLFDFIISLVESIISILLILLIVVVLCQRYSNSGSFFDYRIYTVASESMIPIYGIGDTLLIKDMPASEIKIGDALTYMGEKSDLKGKIVTHQVVDVVEKEDGSIEFHTKGVANSVEDPVVSEDQVLGKVVYKFKSLSILGKITTNMALMLICIIFPVSILIAIEFIKVYKDKLDDEEEVSLLKESDDNKEDEMKNIEIEVVESTSKDIDE